MKIYLEYKKTYADDPERDVAGRIYSKKELKEVFGGTIFMLLGHFFRHPYMLQFIYFPDDLTRYEITGQQETTEEIVQEAEQMGDIPLPF